MKTFVIAAVVSLAVSTIAVAQQVDDDQLPPSALTNAKSLSTQGASIAAGGGVLGRQSTGNVIGVESLPNFSSYFYLDDPFNFGFVWPYTMIGRSPFKPADDGEDAEGSNKTTTINAPIVPVTMDLRNFDGSPRFVNGQRLITSAAAFVDPVLKSPVFSPTSFTSSATDTQYGDAVQRAEFFNVAGPNWHTTLKPRVVTPRTMTLIRGTYRFALNADGTCCAFVLVEVNTFVNALFPPTATDTTTVMGAAENAGDVKVSDFSTFLFPNTYLYFGDPNNCCVLGFHSYDLEPGSAANGWREKRYVMNYSSWISPGLFGAGFTDVTALSHEVSEAFNDPFVNNVTPWWLGPNGNCQNDLEVGDVVEGVPNATFPISLNGFTYHPQNEALLQWFADVVPSNAISQAYSYPNINLLTTPNTPKKPNCKP